MYKALVRSHLDYCDIIYHIPSHQNQAPLGVTLNSLMEKVERIQYQSALAISGAWQGSGRTKLYEELGWESLFGRRMGRRILQIHKIFNNKTPSYLNDKLMVLKIQPTSYFHPRAILTASVINILQKNNLNYLGNQSKLYLYGHPSIISTDNRKIILSTIKYIKDTRRFSS